MKNVKIILGILIVISSKQLCQAQNDSIDLLFDTTKFQRFPGYCSSWGIDFTKIYRQIEPAIKYDYWEFVYQDPGDYREHIREGKTLFRKGEKIKYSNYAKDIKSKYGFCLNCGIEFYARTFIITYQNENLKIIDDYIGLTEFIGDINNIQEVVLIAMINQYLIDENNVIAGSYCERDKDYLLYLTNISVTKGNDIGMGLYKHYSVRAILSKNGDFKIIDKRVFKEHEDPVSLPIY